MEMKLTFQFHWSSKKKRGGGVKIPSDTAANQNCADVYIPGASWQLQFLDHFQPVSCSLAAAAKDYRAPDPGQKRLALTVGTVRTTGARISPVCFFLKRVQRLQKLTSASMQSESGIVPDFEVGEDFQEEPKTYYELKSQPLKNRSVLLPWTVISHAGAFWGLR